MKVKVGVSNRHVHLTKESYECLFGTEQIEKRNDLHQIGEFASTSTVDLEYAGKIIKNIRVVGPFRTHNQVELLGSDGEHLHLSLPSRRSGDLENTPTVVLCNGEKKIITDGVIRAERHVHVPTSRVEELGLHERDEVKITCEKGTFCSLVKVSDNGYFELHIDKDEALAFGLQNGSEVELELIKK